ncbi:PurA-like adenylosuccinate synthetase [Mycobacterium phage Pier]|nr:PurA-like adenylosuccinate synthetase [Mycobacterium phage Pier]
MIKKKAYIVTDLGYGDAGKGTIVDWLCGGDPSTLVVRHNGGSQAGHNVVLDDGTHHEFSQFGSAFLHGAVTFLSRYVMVNPLDMIEEAKHLDEVSQLETTDALSMMFVDAQAKVVTPYHVALQRLKAYARGGSCGKGIGEAVRQHLAMPNLTIRVGHLRDLSLRTSLEQLRHYLLNAADVAGRREDDDSFIDRTVLEDRFLSSHLAERYYAWTKRVGIVDDGDTWLGRYLRGGHTVIFEGAQGVLLDEWAGFHPYTTWSTTTPQNALALMTAARSQVAPINLGVVRSYATRHGNGPFVTEDPELDFDEPHNHEGMWQGKFRQGHLDLVALRYAASVCGQLDGLVVTHLDRDKWRGRDFQVCERYLTDTGLVVSEIQPPVQIGPGARTKQTQVLMDAKPVYDDDDMHLTLDGLLDRLGTIAPVVAGSWGPTPRDKYILKEGVI